MRINPDKDVHGLDTVTFAPYFATTGDPTVSDEDIVFEGLLDARRSLDWQKQGFSFSYGFKRATSGGVLLTRTEGTKT